MNPKRFFLFVILIPFLCYAQERSIVSIPDIRGYKTLLCDFHMHTVFSDGEVWPTVRVDEAWKHGLDAIAITDHLEYQPHKENVTGSFNRSWQLAREYAKGKDIIVIPATEITKGMPPGHFNALFIKDADPILNNNFKLAIKEAANQGAFILWNHPGWKAQQPDTMKWWEEHSFLLHQGWLHGIEVVNYGNFYPEALNWSLDSSLAVLGNSDMHAPFASKRLTPEGHYSLTLVFAADRTEGGIRDALFSGRTLACYDEYIIGKEEYLRALLFEALKIKPLGNNKYVIVNNTDLHFDLALSNEIYEDWKTEVYVKPDHEVIFYLPAETAIESIVISVRNFIRRSDSCIQVAMEDMLKYTE
ncbi:histidinol-phosphatase [Bacteroidota bacterium]